MLKTTDKLVRQHMTYLLSLEDITTELSRFETLYDHILYYSVSVLNMDIHEAVLAIEDFLSDRVFTDSLEENSSDYMMQLS
ncbi:hypothetical protein EHS13_02475 [Paenibacillus psychroresistens]|uniref:Uncharacterized protein n=1 Tax=Paenibacillus psychroresistens TaxID=1778678 RepID=A0A6B8RCC4_9BACL|nr:hypothetical protein [Paenibacillus psychroresistens]QGQ93850.1 hypothetical protein EHS13_02475 [Paenibacillus psychroresistens]